MESGGFELSARFAGGTQAGRQAGKLAPLDKRIQMVASSDGGLEYAQHTALDSRAIRIGENQWRVNWTAPDRADGPVIFHVAANAANHDASALGDFIYTVEGHAGLPASP